MIPILFEKTATTFTSNGIGRLTDCIRCIVTEERNGMYECEFDYPITGKHYSDIEEGRIIAVTHDDNGDIQPFDIYHRTAPLNGVVTFYARHISYRLNGIVVSAFTASGVANAIAGLKTNSIGTNPFTFSTDKTTSGDYTVAVPSTLRALLGGEENSLLDVFGTGEYEFDKFSVKLWAHRGSDTDVQIRYGKNLSDIEHDVDYSDSYNGVVPFWYNTDPTSEAEDPPMILVTASPVYASGTTYDGRNTVCPLDLTQDFTEAVPTSAELTTLATAKLNASDTLLPNENITVSFVQLWQTEEYANIAPLLKVKLCDTVTVIYPELGISGIRSKVIKVVYNTLLDRYDEIELGDALTSYAALITSDTRSALADLEDGLVMVKGAAQQAIADADTAHTAAITAQGAAADAQAAADAAERDAQSALTNAGLAQAAADAAQRDATSANTSANAALTQLGIVEDVVDVLTWISEHGTYKASTDTSVVQGKYYFTRSGTAPNYTYTVVASPTGNPSTQGYYELDSVDEAVSNYISSHLALTNQGLWVINDNNSYKILLASDGMYVYNPSGTVVGRYGSTAQIGANGTTRFVIDAGKLQAYDSSGNKYFEVSASGLTFGSYTAAKTSDIPTNVSQLTNDSGYQNSTQVNNTVSSAIDSLIEVKTATGSIVSVSDASPYPALDVQSDIEPIQDLNGYDSVWVGGAGKNKLPNNATDGTTTSNSVTLKSANGVYTLSGTASATTTFTIPLAGSVDLSPSTNKICFLNSGNNSSVEVHFLRGTTTVHYWGMSPTNRVASGWTDSGNEVIDTLIIRVYSGANSAMTISPMLVALNETTPTTFAPYENICPISGHTDVVVSRTGKNLCDGVFANGYYTPEGTWVADNANRTAIVKVKPSTKYSSSFYTSSGTRLNHLVSLQFDENMTPISDGWKTDQTITTKANVVWLAVRAFAAQSSYITGNDFAYQVEEGETYTALSNYGDTYTIDLDGTRYGGTLDVTSGVLTVTHNYVGGSSWVQYNSSNGYKAYRIQNLPTAYGGGAISNMVSEWGTFSSSSMTKNIIQLPDANTYTAYMALQDSASASDVYFCYRLLEPFDVNLTAQEIELLENTNNLWTNCGTTTLDYAVLNSDMLALAEQTGKSNKFITQIGSDGIKVHAQDNIDQNYAKIDANGMEVYKGGSKVAKFGQNIELSDGTKTLYEVITTSGAVKVTRLYNRTFDNTYAYVYDADKADRVELGRTINSGLSVKLNYKINSTAYTATYTSLPISVNAKYGLDCSLTGTTMLVYFAAGDTLGDAETLTIVSLEISFTTTQTVAESTLGAYADKTQTGSLRIGNGTGTNAKSNAMLVDLAGNAYFKGNVYTGCNADSTGGLNISNGFEMDGITFEGSNYELSLNVYRVGQIVMLNYWATRTVSVASGNNLFYVSLANAPIPVPIGAVNVTGTTFYGAHALTTSIQYDFDSDVWRFVMRNASASAVTLSGAEGTLTYITDGQLTNNFSL